MTRVIGPAIVFAISALVTFAAGADPMADSKNLFERRCGMCHEAVGMGTGLLSRRMDPATAPLEKHMNLTAEYITKWARLGLGNMPPITRADVSDLELADIARYLSRTTGP